MTILYIDSKVIFASVAPATDKPPVFSDKTKGWEYSNLTTSNNLSDVEDKAEARTALNLTDEQVDTIWESPLV